MKKLTDICDIQYGYAFDSKCFTEDSSYPPLVRIRDVKRGYSETYYSGDYPEEYILSAGDLLVGMDGEFNIARWKCSGALLNQRVCKLAAKLGTNEEYLRFAMLDELIKARFVEMFGDPVSNSYDLPEATLPDLGKFGRGVSKHRPRNDIKLLGGKYPLIQTGDVANAGLYITSYSNTYSELGLKQSKMWDKGTLCITIAANIAKTAILDRQIKICGSKGIG